MAATVQIREKNTAGQTATDKTSGTIRFKKADDATVDRRSGRQALALHHVVRPVLPAPAARLVSCGPSSGEPRRPSRQMLGLAHATPLRRFAPANPKVHQ